MDTSELIDKLYEYYEDYGQGSSPSLFQISMACKEAAVKIQELQQLIDEKMNAEHYVDQLEYYKTLCRSYENTLDQINTILNK